MLERSDFSSVCASLNIPQEICQSYQNKGLNKLHQWQMECLFTTKVLAGENLIYCAPTGGGKTLVAELIILKTVIALKKRAILILPYVSLVSEKEKEFRRLVTIYNRAVPLSERVRIRGYHGETKSIGKLKEHIIICTIEKANTLCNVLISRGLLHQLGCVVVDEMHVLGDFHRGYHLEILISKLKFIIQNSHLKDTVSIQLIALSATIQNIEDLARWFHAALYVTSHRPVPLREMVCAGTDVFESSGVHLRKIEFTKTKLDIESLTMVSLALEGLRQGQQVIIFCPSRNQCETTVKLLTTQLSDLSQQTLPPQAAGAADQVEARKKAIGEYRRTYPLGHRPTPSQEILERGIGVGVAYHHAGLSSEERDIVEELFRNGHIYFLAATTTLAAGVNLPAGRVLIRSMKVGQNQLLEPIQYRQMCGRAGRPGLTAYGESFLIVKQSDRIDALALCNRPLPKISSQIHPSIDGGKAFLKVLLELFLLHLCETLEFVNDYVAHTMVYLECLNTIPSTNIMLMESVYSLLNFLVSANAIEIFPLDTPHHILPEIPTSIISLQHSQSLGIRITRFGRAVAESNLNPDEAISIYEDLIRAREQGINLESNLHLLYLITPQNHSLSPDYKKLLNVYQNSKGQGDSTHITFDSIGLDTNLLAKWSHFPPTFDQISSCVDRLKLFKIKTNHQMTSSSTSSSTSTSKLTLDENDCIMLYRCLRIWAASALSMLIETQSLSKVAATYNVTINDITSLQKSAGYLCSRIVRFCQEIGWLSVEKLMSYISGCISCEPEKEIKNLMILPGMSSKLAKILVDYGYDNVELLANATNEEIVHRLLLSRQFEINEEGKNFDSMKNDGSIHSFGASLIAAARSHLEKSKEIDQGGDGDGSENKDDKETGVDANRSEELDPCDGDEDDAEDEEDDEDDDDDDEEEAMSYMFQINPNAQPEETVKIEELKTMIDVNGKYTQLDIQEELYACQQPPTNEEHLSMRDEHEEISDEALLQLMESFDNKVNQHHHHTIIANTPNTVEGVNQPSYVSPYLQPFTPSKRSTPGRYLYLPPLDDCHHPSSIATDVLISDPSQMNSKAFFWRHLSDKIYCKEFLNKLRHCNCISFELVFDTIPISNSGLSHSIVTRAWAPMIASRHSSNGSKKDQSHQTQLPTILIGISICFGDEFGYYLPLPKIPPLLSLPKVIHEQKFTQSTSPNKIITLNSLPERSLILICRYVGFVKILHQCSGLYPHDYEISLLQNSTSNPLMLVSKKWAEISRRSLRYEWMRGQCLEWRLLGKIMNSTSITKISYDLKDKLICLRERDVIVQGLIEDPKVATNLLENSDVIQVTLPSMKSSPNVMNSIKEACLTAINSFRKMGELELALKSNTLWSTFINIEMPLCYTVADAELNGMPIDTAFFTDLRQDLNDRVKIIEYFFRETQGINFNLSNTRDVANLKSQLLLHHHEQQQLTRSSTDEGSEPHVLLQLIQEWRSHTRLIPLCNLILSSRCRPYGHQMDRTRGKYHPLGTETGRLIIASPPLQQIPHSCSYLPPLRTHLHNELQQARLKSQEIRFISEINQKSQCGESEWVRVTKLNKYLELNEINSNGGSGSGRGSHNSNNNNYFYYDHGMKPGHIISYSTGKLIAVTSISINKFLISDLTLLEIWRRAGFQYSPDDGMNIVGVMININNKVYSYPADQVYRLQAPIIPDQNETIQIKSSLLNPSSSSSSSYSSSSHSPSPPLLPSPFSTTPTPTTTPPPLQKMLINPRNGFQASPGHVFISSDYSQIELRIFAHYAMDHKLYKAFHNNEDIFISIASQWKSKLSSDVTITERNLIKQLCYALLYGAGPNKISQDANCSLQEAQEIMNHFLSYYSGIPKFINEIKKKCYQNGFIETMLGRRRHLLNIHSSNYQERSKAERQAVNTLCQGSAADLIKLAMINIHYCLQRRYENKNYHSRRSYPGGGIYSILDSIRLVLQVHDELIYEVPTNYLHEVGYIIKYCMENAVELNVPLKVNLFYGETWGAMAPLQLDSINSQSINIYNELFQELSATKILNNYSSLQPVARCIFTREEEEGVGGGREGMRKREGNNQDQQQDHHQEQKMRKK